MSDPCDEIRPPCPPAPVDPIKDPIEELAPIKKPVEEEAGPIKTEENPSVSSIKGKGKGRLTNGCASLFRGGFQESHPFYGSPGRFGSSGPLQDHLSRGPLSLWATGIHAVTRIAHRIHGIPFCWGWRCKLPSSTADFIELACNVIIERRSTNWWRGARRGAALFDWLFRWAPWLQQFSSAGDAAASLPNDMLLSPTELDLIRSATVQYAPTVDPTILINVLQSTEQALWWRDTFGSVSRYDPPSEFDSEAYKSANNARAKREMAKRRMTAWRLQSLIESDKPVPWRLEYLRRPDSP